MKLSQLAIQLYTLRDVCKTESDLVSTLHKVRAIGYEAVQVSGIVSLPPARVAELCRDAGVVIAATHENSDDIRCQPEKVVERLKEYEVVDTAYPYPAGVEFTNAEHVDALIADLAKAAEVFAQNGCRLSYHNHAVEFVKSKGRTILQRIKEETPETLKFELDTYWVHFGGGDVAGWCESLPGRLPVMHLKDYKFLPENYPVFSEIGEGNLDFQKIVRAAENSGCEWFVVEQDTCPGDPFVSIEKSFRYCKEHLVS